MRQAHPMKKLLLILTFGILAILFFSFDLHQLLTLENIKEKQGELNDWKNSAPLVAALIFASVYVLITGLSLPGAAVMTLVAGALFGVAWGTLIVSFASSIGATLAFMVSRYILKDTIQAKYGDRLSAINAGVEKDGAFYLFTLRLVPAFPFFLVNILMALTPIRVGVFYVVSQIGMLAGTLVFVNAGTQLAQIDSLSGILSPMLIASFVLLGIFPLLVKKAMDVINARKVYAKWSKPKSFDRNLIVIGAGAGGLVSAYIASAVKAKVTLIESHKMGGDCLNYGCVPSKALIKSAKVAQQMKEGEHYGLENVEPEFSFRKVMARVHDIVKAIEPHDSVERYTELGVEVLEGYGKIIDPWTVEIKLNSGEVQRLTTRSIIIAAGAAPFVPSIPGLDEVGYLTSDTLWEELSHQDEVPKRVLILGGGPIGSELAQAFARLGASVTQVEQHSRIMKREDEEVSELAQSSLQKSGVQVLTGHKALRCEVHDGEKVLVVEQQVEGRENNQEESLNEKVIAFDALICAVGRSARLTGYGLEELGIETKNTVVTNEYLQTLYPNIYAAGDVAGPYQFTHTAAHQAWYAAVNALFGTFKMFKADYSVIPWATFIDPEVARVGLNEQDAIEQNVAYEVTRYGIDDLDRAIADGDAVGFVKVLTVPGKDKILGVTIVGTHAGDLLTEFVLAIKHGLGLNKILGTIHTYPTLSESNKYAAGEWKRAHAPEKLLSYVEKYHNWRRG